MMNYYEFSTTSGKKSYFFRTSPSHVFQSILSQAQNKKTFILDHQVYAIEEISKIIKRPNKNHTVLYAQMEGNKIIYNVLDNKKFKIRQIEKLSEEENQIFQEKKKVYEWVSPVEKGVIFSAVEVKDQLNMEQSEVINQILGLCEAKILIPVYKNNSEEDLYNRSNQKIDKEWSEKLEADKLYLEDGTEWHRDLKQILISFKKIV